MPPKFHYPDDVDVWQRLRWDLTQHSRRAHFMEAVARLVRRHDIRAGAERGRRARDCVCRAEFGDTHEQGRLGDRGSMPLLDEQLGYYRPALMVLFGAVGLLLVIGCLNVASLLLTRALSRDREIAVRIAMGASPRQLVTQLLAESLVLSRGGRRSSALRRGRGALPLILGVTPVRFRGSTKRAIDVRALWDSASSFVVVTTLFFGLVPALLLLQDAAHHRAASRANAAARAARGGSTRCWSPARSRSPARCSSARRCWFAPSRR